MSGAEREPKSAKSRWQSIAASRTFLIAMCIAPIAFQAFHYRLRLFFSADWRYAITFVTFSAAMGFLMFQYRSILQPKRHMEDREFDRLSLMNGLLLASIFAVYYLFDDYSDHSMNLYSLVGKAVACGIVFLVGLFGVKNPPETNEPNPSKPSDGRPLPQS